MRSIDDDLDTRSSEGIILSITLEDDIFDCLMRSFILETYDALVVEEKARNRSGLTEIPTI